MKGGEIMGRPGGYAFTWNNKKFYYKSNKIEFIYNLLFLILGGAVFYFYYILLYVIMYNQYGYV